MKKNLRQIILILLSYLLLIYFFSRNASQDIDVYKNLLSDSILNNIQSNISFKTSILEFLEQDKFKEVKSYSILKLKSDLTSYEEIYMKDNNLNVNYLDDLYIRSHILQKQLCDDDCLGIENAELDFVKRKINEQQD